MRAFALRLYTAAATLASLALTGPALALSPEARAAVDAARQGDMARLVLHASPKEPVTTPFAGPDGEVTIAAWAGRVVLMNFWATWCPPCLKEMPSLDRLQAALGGDDFQVVAVSTDRGDPGKPARWLADNRIERLQLYHDARLRLAQASALLGQPTTLVIDRQGREIARFTGETEWDAPEAQALIRAVIAATAVGG
jgi:thiol-disulfide isomerase/thioredoxin